MAKYKKEEVQNSRDTLLRWVTPDTQYYTSLRSVSRSGMSRQISVYVVVNGGIVNISHYVARVLGLPDKGGAVKIDGVGMDMGWKLCYNLFCALFPSEDYTKRFKHAWM